MNSSFFHTGNLALRKCLCQKCADELKVIFMNSSKFLLEENLMRISDQITHGGQSQSRFEVQVGYPNQYVQIYRHPSKIISRATEDYKILILFLKVSFFDKHDFTNSFFSKYGPKSREEISNFTGYPSNHFKGMRVGTIHLRCQHVLGGEECPLVPMVKRSQYKRIKNPLHKHIAEMPMVGGQGSKIVKICRRLKWMVP